MKKKRIPRLSVSDVVLLHEVRRLMEVSPSGDYTIKELSVRVGINRNKLVWGFRKLHGQSIRQFLIALRMKTARSLLIHSDRPLKEIASLSGYSSAANFITAFKKFYGKTPGEYQMRK